MLRLLGQSVNDKRACAEQCARCRRQNLRFLGTVCASKDNFPAVQLELSSASRMLPAGSLLDSIEKFVNMLSNVDPAYAIRAQSSGQAGGPQRRPLECWSVDATPAARRPISLASEISSDSRLLLIQSLPRNAFVRTYRQNHFHPSEEKRRPQSDGAICRAVACERSVERDRLAKKR